jgi:hypothetical protein
MTSAKRFLPDSISMHKLAYLTDRDTGGFRRPIDPSAVSGENLTKI